MEKEYLLVEWIGEKKYSCVPKTSLVDGTVRLLPGEAIIGNVYKFLWKKKQYDGKIHTFGSKSNMEFELAAIIAEKDAQNDTTGSSPEVQDATASPKNAGNEKTLAELTTIMDLYQSAPPSSSLRDADCHDQMKLKLEKERTRAEKYKDLAKRRGKEIAELRNKLDAMPRSENMIAIGETTFMSQSDIDTVRTLSDSANVFARNLMRIIFKDEEIVGKSLFGKRSNANKEREQLPSLDSEKRDAIILYTMKEFGHPIDNVLKRKNAVLRDLKRSMCDFLREKTAKRRKQEETPMI